MAPKQKKDDGSRAVAVDDDAVALRDPVTVVVSPAGNRYDADTWSDANNLLALGYSIADGFPTGPVQSATADGPDVTPAVPAQAPGDGERPA